MSLTVFDLLGILEYCIGGSSRWTVGRYCWQHCLVHLLPVHLDLDEDHGDDDGGGDDENDDDDTIVSLIIAGQ